MLLELGIGESAIVSMVVEDVDAAVAGKGFVCDLGLYCFFPGDGFVWVDEGMVTVVIDKHRDVVVSSRGKKT